MSPPATDPVRRQACLALDAVLHGGKSLESALSGRELTGVALSRCRALVFTSCRWQPRLQAVIDQLIAKPLRRRDRPVYSVLLLALAELEYFDSPEHAVVDSAVSLTRALGHRALSGLVNAVLRRFLRERDGLTARVDVDPAAACGHPKWIYDALHNDWPTRAKAVVQANNTRAPMTIRVAARASRADYAARLASRGIAADAGPGAADLTLRVPVDVGELPGFDSGDCSVQDSAAQFAAGLLAANRGERILDACAAPGGKTGHLLELGCDPESLTVLDVSSERLERVVSGVQRLGFGGLRFAAADARRVSDWWDGELFDAILLDAPCSGMGVVRRHPDIKVLRRASDIAQSVKLQAELLDTLWPLLRPGGRMLYATCSTLRCENDLQIASFGKRTSDVAFVHLDLPVGCRSDPGWQIMPGEMGCDGFYYALMHRESESGRT